MSTSAIVQRELKRVHTTHAIHRSALELTISAGLDGWTMTDLAERAEVSRRTLFNYFPSKVDAVFGSRPVLDEWLVGEFRTGGPSGNLMHDLVALAISALDQADDTRTTVELKYRALSACPQFAMTMLADFEQRMREVSEHIAVREGSNFDSHRARLALGSIKTLIDSAMQTMAEDPGSPPFADLLRTGLRELERLHSVP